MQGIADAVVLDWDTVSWADGSLNNTYQPDAADPDSTVNINVAQNNGAPFVGWSGDPSRMAPAVIPAFQGGLGSTENTLTLALDLANTSQSVTVTVSFAASGGATGVSFSLFDVDFAGSAQDQISSIHALSIDGSTLIAPTITGSASNLVTGSGVNQVITGTASASDTGATSNRGNVSISFGSNAIQSFTFTYGATTAFANPGYQHIGIYDISFTPIPEMNPTIVSVLSCFAATGLVLRHRSRFRK